MTGLLLPIPCPVLPLRTQPDCVWLRELVASLLFQGCLHPDSHVWISPIALEVLVQMQDLG